MNNFEPASKGMKRKKPKYCEAIDSDGKLLKGCKNPPNFQCEQSGLYFCSFHARELVKRNRKIDREISFKTIEQQSPTLK